MNVGVRVRRAIMQDEPCCARARGANLLIQILVSPFFQARGFCLRQIRLLPELSLRQVDRFL